MSSGFNTDVRVGDNVFHVQTEDRGPAHPVIDTVVYQNGRVLYRRASDYSEFLASSQFEADELRNRVREQHKSVIEALRSGSFAAEIAAADQSTHQSGQSSTASESAGADSPADVMDLAAVKVQLLNPNSWLSAGNVFLDLEIFHPADRRPAEGAQVEATIEGSLKDLLERATADGSGRARLQFPLPPLGKGDLALVVRARQGDARDELRFVMRKRNPAPTAL